MRLAGRVGLPTYSRPNALQQFVFVNGRAVRDKMLSGALRGGLYGFSPLATATPSVALFVECDPREVDVNVHPAKAEVRFRDSGLVRGLVVGAVKQRLERGAAQVGDRPADRPRCSPCARRRRFDRAAPSGAWDWRASPAAPGFARAGAGELRRLRARRAGARRARPASAISPPRSARPARRCMAITSSPRPRDGLVIVDQHAAHERIVYEKLKRQRDGAGIERQALLTPIVVDLDPDAASLIETHAQELAALGLVVEGFGPGAILVREAPAVLADGDIRGLVRDLAADLAAEDGAQSLARRLDHRLATFACRHSVRSGRALKAEEMNALLREMETTPGAGQCNHGRPTYVELKLADIERLFGRR